MTHSRSVTLFVILPVLACSVPDRPTGPETWSLAVSVATVGHSQDPDGYQVLLNGEATGHLTVEDTLFVSQLDPGQYTIELADVAGNCRPHPGLQTVGLVPGGNASAAFSIGCDSVLRGVILFTRLTPAPPGSVGIIEIFQVRPDGSGLARVTQGSHARASPDGRQIVFNRTSPVFSIFRMNVDGTQLVDLTPGTVEDQCPVWSPDGSSIVFSSRRSGEFQMYSMRPDGSGQQRLTFSDLQEGCGASWSPDGSRFAFGRSTPGNASSEIFVINADGTGEQKLSGPGDDSPAWSPDGTHILFNSVRSGSNQLWLMLADGQSPQNFTNAEEFTHNGAVWSPDGAEIVFSRAGVRSSSLFRMGADGTNLVPLTDGNFLDSPSDWLP
jgi:Tol biopolymer transport system component